MKLTNKHRKSTIFYVRNKIQFINRPKEDLIMYEN